MHACIYVIYIYTHIVGISCTPVVSLPTLTAKLHLFFPRGFVDCTSHHLILLNGLVLLDSPFVLLGQLALEGLDIWP